MMMILDDVVVDDWKNHHDLVVSMPVVYVNYVTEDFPRSMVKYYY